MSKRYPFIEDLKDLMKRGLSGVPMVAPIIPRTGPWTGDNQLGNIAAYGPDKRGTQTILKLDEWGPPEMWTVSLFLKQTFESFNGFNVRARIGFGAGGATQIYECDWINGCQISFPMNAVNVEALFENVDIIAEGAGLSLGVQISRGSRGGTSPPRITIVENQNFPNGQQAFDLPAFAKRVVLVPTGNDAAGFAALYNVLTTLSTNSGPPGGTGDTVAENAGDKFQPGGILAVPVTGQARSITVSNPTADDFNATLYVELDG